MKKNRVLIVIAVIILAIAASAAAVLITRYIKYKPIMGTYELVDGNRDTPLVLNLYKWSMGKKEDLKCVLYDCTGYHEGSSYSMTDKTIKFRFDSSRYFEENYKITTEGDITYLVLTTTTADGEVIINKYKKVK